MKRGIKYFAGTAAALSALLFVQCQSGEAQTKNKEVSLEEGFKTPPESVKPAVYWYWLNDNISKEGAIKDLEAMKEMGIGTAFMGNIGNQAGDFGKLPFGSDGWWDVVHASLKKAGELGIDIGIFNSPGWSQSGGPWIKPERSMRYLASSEIRVKGGQKVEVNIPAPGEDFQDVRTIAFLAPKNDGDLFSALKPKVKTSPEFANAQALSDGGRGEGIVIDKELKELTIDIAANKDFTARSLTLYFTSYTKAEAELFANVDGRFRSVKKFEIKRVYHKKLPNIVGYEVFAPFTVAIPATKAKEFRLVLKNIPEAAIAEVEFSSYPRIDKFAEKKLAKMHPDPAPTWGSYMWDDAAKLEDPAFAVKSADVMDISEFMKKDGTLVWNAPKGDWVIQRTGMLSSRVTNNPATGSARGLETDKMSKEHIEFHFNSYMGEVLKRIPAEDRKTFKYVVQDSFETGSQNWTDGFAKEFEKRYGYDPVKFIPVLSGRVVDSAEISDRFLWDMRRLVADKVAYDYVAGMREVAHKNGLKTWLENYGHWGFPGEFLQYGGQSDFVSGEFWNEGLGTVENRAASSCVHIYGKDKVWSESYTAGGKDYERSPASLKRRGDMAYVEGINQTLLHVYMHQPYEDKTPGINAWFSTEFNRKNTWFFKMKPFIQYLRRNMFMLQQGVNVADIAYFIGEDAPKMTGILSPELPQGYNFDYINAEVIINALEVKDGILTLPHGTTYRLLVLPPQDTMRPELLKKIRKLAEDGALVLGPKPTRSPSFENYPECDRDVKKLADQLWGNVDGVKVKSRKVGKGIIASGLGIQEALDLVKVVPDFGSSDKNVQYVHRSLKDAEVYFVTNQNAKPVEAKLSFRVAGKAPELWDSNTGEMRPLPAFETKNGITTIPMKFDTYQSAFVVFRKAGNPTGKTLADNYPARTKLADVAKNWKVDFLEKKFGPKDVQNFSELSDWSKSGDDAIKYYSGTAVYKNTFEVKNVSGFKKVTIDLGRVEALAGVKINGKCAGGVWTPPYALDITKLVKEGANEIEVEVTNTWINRLVGDLSLPEEKRNTWQLVKYISEKTPLKSSGLLGPVLVLGEK